MIRHLLSMLFAPWRRESPSALRVNGVSVDNLPVDPTPAHAVALAGLVVGIAHAAGAADLDYSPASLAHVDRLVLSIRGDRRHKHRGVGLLLFLFGCYVGEVFVRHANARWVMPDESEQRFGFHVMGIRTADCQFVNVIGKVFKLMKYGEEDSVGFFYGVFSDSDRTQAMLNGTA